MLAVPQLQHQHLPDDVAVEGRRVRSVEPEELFEGAGPEVGPDAGIRAQESVVDEIHEPRVRPEPQAGRNAEPVLRLDESLPGE